MNAHNNENDPLEDVFRDRFADFESEPDTQLWQKIEPQLPVNPTRKFPYWQTSVIMILLLLAGLWTYREKDLDDLITKSEGNQTEKITQSDDSQTNKITRSDENQTENITKSPDSRTENSPLLSIKTTGKHNQKIIENLTVNDLTENTTKNISVEPEEKIAEAKLPNRVSDGSKEVFLQHDRVTNDNKTSVYSLFSKPNTTIDIEKTSSNKTPDKSISKNKILGLNLSSFENSKENKSELIIDNLSNKQSVSSVFSQKEKVTVLNKNYLTLIEPKPYNLLRNYFKTPKLKFVVAQKKEDYFKERKPLEMYASVMPLLNYYTITPNGNDANYVHSIAVNNDDDRLGFYTQAGVIFTLSDKFKLRTGLTFTKTNHSINYQIRTDSLVVQPSDNKGVDVSFEEKKATYSQVANYLGTKIEVQYIFLEGEALTHYVNVGLEGAYRLNGIKQFNGFANFAYGVTRQIGDNSYLFVEPTFSYSLNQHNDNNSFLLVKPNKIGFNIGINFKIK